MKGAQSALNEHKEKWVFPLYIVNKAVKLVWRSSGYFSTNKILVVICSFPDKNFTK
jgi:hypothetical protein